MKLSLLLFLFLTSISCVDDVPFEKVTGVPPVVDLTPTPLVEANIVPDEFAGTDFRNFKYPFGKLVDGEIDGRTGDPREGSLSYYFGSVDYADVTGGPDKEAIVRIVSVGCGGSCDGGSSHIYVFGIDKNKPRLLGTIDTGSRADGCSIKTLTIENKKLIIEQFGQCKDDVDNASNPTLDKYTIADVTENIFAFQGNKLARISSIITTSEPFNAGNYEPIITVK